MHILRVRVLLFEFVTFLAIEVLHLAVAHHICNRDRSEGIFHAGNHSVDQRSVVEGQALKRRVRLCLSQLQ